MKKFLWNIFLAAGIASMGAGSVNAQPGELPNTNFSLFGSALFSADFHNAAFNRLGSFDPVMNTKFFDQGRGLGGAALVGIEYAPQGFLSGLPVRFGANLSFGYHSGALEKQDIDGYGIGDDHSGYRTSINHRLHNTLALVSLEPNISLRPFASVPFEFFTGLQLSLPLVADYEYSETLVAHNVIEDFTPKSMGSGEIPDNPALLAATYFGLRYELIRHDNYSIMPEIGYNYALNDLAANTSWRINSLRGGISVRYQIPAAVEPPPVIAREPEPVPPPVIAAKRLELDFNLVAGGRVLRDGEDIRLPVSVTRYKQRTVIPAVLFFEKNSAEIRSQEKFSVPQLTLDYLRNNPDISVRISGSASPDEDPRIAGERAQAMVNFLAAHGIAPKRITTVSASGISKVRYEELLQEQRNVTVEFSNIAAIVPHEELLREEKDFNLAELEFRPDILAEASPYAATGQAQIAGVNIPLSDGRTALELPAAKIISTMQEQMLKIEYGVRDAQGKSLSKEKEYRIIPEAQVTEQVNVVGGRTESQPVQEFMLGYFKFDESKFYAINYEALRLAREAVKNGRTIEVLALTDNLGSEDYNSGLARSRAQEAIRTLGLAAEKVSIAAPQRAYFSNESPQGRIMNRSVVLRIR